jgi:hypothetical protein
VYRENKPIELSPYDHPDIYPGPRPSSSFIYYEGKAHYIEETPGVPVEGLMVHVAKSEHLLGSFAFSPYKKMTIADFLEENEFTPMKDRVPLLAYGSNVCLAQLKYKFGLNPSQNDLVIHIRSEIKDTDVVYGAFLAPYGSLPAVIAPVKGAQSEVWVTFVDKLQLELITRTEETYELREHRGGKLQLANDEYFEAVYAYYYPHALLDKGNYVRFNDIGGSSPLKGMWQADMINKMKQRLDYKGTREEFIHLLRWSYVVKQQVEVQLKEFEDQFDHPDWKCAEKILSVGEMGRKFS